MRSKPTCWCENDHSDAADSFCACCLIEADRVGVVRRAAFLRLRYAIRRFRFTRTLCFCPMESLWIENRRNAIGIERDRVGFFARYSLTLAKESSTSPSPREGEATSGAIRIHSIVERIDAGRARVDL